MEVKYRQAFRCLKESEMKLKSVIRGLQKEAKAAEYQYKHGSPVSSMAEDATEGEVARRLRQVISKLKKVTSL